MVPDTDLQLSVVIKALETAVIPALDPSNRLAMEQCHLAVATLGFIRLRLPLTRRMQRKELSDNLALAESLRDSSKADDMGSQIDGGRAALADADMDTSDLAMLNSQLLCAITSVVETAQGDREIALTVITAMKDQAQRARAWYLPGGFEPEPALIPAIETLLSGPTFR
jgi:hypothetical protein